ncbi:MAG TPA: acetate--CoA ligase [Blastocatellia bacterium]|nr:acetate--CoA ligase [Blastocatellia bacterium]
MSETNAIESVLSETRVFQPPSDFASKAHISGFEAYEKLYAEAEADPSAFWEKQAADLHWFKRWEKVLEWNEPFAKWFVGGKINVSYNCLDRHASTWRKNKAAIIWEGEPGEKRVITYQQLHRDVCRFSNVLKRHKVRKGDRVVIYMPMVPEAAVAMLACARLGVIHTVIFGGFSAEAIKDRVNDCQAKLVITADAGWRRGKAIELKANVDRALTGTPSVQHVIVLKRTGTPVTMVEGRDRWYHDFIAGASGAHKAKGFDSENPLFILYTSGSTGKPKGVLHTTAGYLLGTAITTKYVFDLKETDIYFCTADIGWITGHSYVVYGPLANGATTLMFEGVPNYPSTSRFWEVIDKHQVNIFYTAPTAIRALMREGEGPVKATSRRSLRLLGSVGEPINPEAWLWYHRVVGEGRCPIVDTWWQTETGGILISPLPGAIAQKPGSATKPFFGIVPQLVDEKGALIEGAASGNLVIADSWPGQMRTVFGDHQRFIDTYFRTYPGKYFTGDGCRRDEDGYYWITGRVDDVINVSGHRIGTAEVESALVGHTDVAEAAVVGYPHDLKGQGIYAYVTLKLGIEPSEALRKALVARVRREIGPIASPDVIQWAPGLPKTRSGKIMRRILRKIAENELGSLGDTSTLADPGVVQNLIDQRPQG